jgi:hypothetical protein
MPHLHVPRLAPLAAAALAALLTAPALAAPTTLSATSSASTPGETGIGTGFNQPGYISSSTTANEPDVGYAQGGSFANQWGTYAVRAGTEGKGAASGSAGLGYEIVNNTGVRQSYSMSFYVYGGYLELFQAFGAPALQAGDWLRAEYTASITRGASVLFNSSALLTYSDTSGSFAYGLQKAGTDLNPSDTGGDGTYGWGGQTFTIDLGELDAGESMTINANLATLASSNVGTYSYSGGGGGYGGYGYGSCGGGGYETIGIGEEAATQGSGQLCFVGGSRAFYGDPANIDFGNEETGQNDPGIVITSTAVNNQVPEPGSFGLAGLALWMGVAARRRARRQS